MEVVGLAKNGEEAVEMVNELQPDICIMDIEMPIKTGLDAAEALRGNDCKIIILTTFARPGYFERARKAGVRGYLLKDSPIEELVNSIRIIMDGRRIYAPELVDFVYEEDSENPLTDRESQVLELVAEGKTTKDQQNRHRKLPPESPGNLPGMASNQLGCREGKQRNH